MLEVMADEEVEQLLEPAPKDEKDLLENRIGWPIVIDFQTFCQRLIGYGFTSTKLAQVKAALVEAELAYRYVGKKRKEQI